jgi:hypothetical protein
LQHSFVWLLTLFAQTDIYIHQECHQKNIGMLSHNDLVGIRVDKETLKFSVPKFDEPTQIVFSVDSINTKKRFANQIAKRFLVENLI